MCCKKWIAPNFYMIQIVLVDTWDIFLAVRVGSGMWLYITELKADRSVCVRKQTCIVSMLEIQWIKPRSCVRALTVVCVTYVMFMSLCWPAQLPCHPLSRPLWLKTHMFSHFWNVYSFIRSWSQFSNRTEIRGHGMHLVLEVKKSYYLSTASEFPDFKVIILKFSWHHAPFFIHFMVHMFYARAIQRI